MKTLEIVGDNHFEVWTKHRVACRGVVIREDKVLLSYEEKTDQYGIPGGGMEDQETTEMCCAREIAEETGIVVLVNEKYLTMHEFYEEWFFETHYFVCSVIGEIEKNLTIREQQVGMLPKWVDIQEAIDIFSKHQDYAETNEEKRGIYLREYMALCELVLDHSQ